MIRSLSILWKFSRPHTIIGSVISMTVLWLVALESKVYADHIALLMWTLLAGVACNIFIVGLNQIMDIELDKINKPNLPLASGSLTKANGYKIISISLVISLLIAFLTSVILGWLIVIILIIGIAYSVPPIQLKRHHILAAFAITIVRGVLVNVGMFLHFNYTSDNLSIQSMTYETIKIIPDLVWMLTSFVVAFSIAIAWFKDLPDTDGDSQFKIKTLAIVYSPKMALYGGIALVSIAYLGTILWSYLLDYHFLTICHLAAFILFMANVVAVDLKIPEKVTRFYMVFWIFFFLEYIFFGVHTLL